MWLQVALSNDQSHHTRNGTAIIGKVATRLRQIFLELSIEKGWNILALEVAPDHIHLFVAIKPTDTPFKGRSLWTSSYFVNTAGNISSEAVIKYIEDPHHTAN